jgi:hypothetical protein
LLNPLGALIVALVALSAVVFAVLRRK